MTERPYHELLKRMRDAFPAPVSDRKHDAYFVFSILRALDEVDDLKSEVPLLGRPRALDYAAAERAELNEEGRSVEEVAHLLVGRLEGMPIWGHPRTQINVVPPPSIPSVIGSLLPAIYNPNLVSDDTSYGLMLTEASVAAMVSRLVGYDPARAAGVFTFGGTGTVLYGAKLGIEKAFPDAMEDGVPAGGGVILASAQSHYCRLNVAGWLGLGEKSVVEVPTHLQNDIRIDRLEAAAREALDRGRRIAALVATMGTTDAFGIDDLDAVGDLREHLEGHGSTTVLNDDAVGTVTVFRVYPDGVDTWTIKDRERTDPAAREELLRHNDYNRRLFRHLYDRAMRGEGVHISMTDCYRETEYGEPMVGLKSFVLSPFIDEHDVEQLVRDILDARQAIGDAS